VVRLVPVSRYQEPENRDVTLCEAAVASLALVGLRFALVVNSALAGSDAAPAMPGPFKNEGRLTRLRR
jgi:hypothetical protein